MSPPLSVIPGGGETAAVIQAYREKIDRAAEAECREYGSTEVNAMDSITSQEILAALSMGEDGDAALVVRLFKGRLCFDHASQDWYKWTGHHWERDALEERYNAIGEVISLYRAEADCQGKQAGDAAEQEGGRKKDAEGRRAALLGRCRELHRRRKKDDVLFLAARGADGLGTTGKKWDSDPWLLGLANGVMDLRTGELRPGRPEDFIRTASPVEWKGLEALAPAWEKFLESVFAGNFDLIFYLQRLFGYALTGLTLEHILLVLWGELGRNGKSTLLEVLGAVLGRLAGPIEAEMLLESGRVRSSAGPSPDMLSLRGKRLVWASESDEGRKLNAGRIKSLTGGDTLTARGMYAKWPEEFQPSHLLCLLTNHRPRVDADDFALWQRLRLIPFNVRFVDNPEEGKNEARKDPDLKAKLLAEAPGILAWLVQGCLEWQLHRLGEPPAAVVAATSEYQEAEDLLNPFIQPECLTGPGMQVQVGHLYEKYKAWALTGGLHPLSLPRFSEKMGRKFECMESRGRKFFIGLGLRTKEGHSPGAC